MRRKYSYAGSYAFKASRQWKLELKQGLGDRPELIAAVRPYWNRYKGQHGLDRAALEQALRSLIFDHNYNRQDIALMFGVTRERVRQWCNSFGIDASRTFSSFRIWDWDLGRFRACTRQEYVRTVASAKRRDRTEETAWKMNADLDRLLLRSKELGRSPSVSEVWDNDGEYQAVTRRWQGARNESYQEILDRLWAIAGLSERPDARAWRWNGKP